jgi:hypothetical protein
MPPGCHDGSVGGNIRAAHRLIAEIDVSGVPFAEAMRRSVNRAVGFDGYYLFAVDPLTGPRSAMFSEHGLTVSSARLMRNETVDKDVNRYASLLRRPGHTGLLKVGAGAPRSPRLYEMLLPQGYSSELRLVLVQDGRYWGGSIAVPRRPAASLQRGRRRGRPGSGQCALLGIAPSPRTPHRHRRRGSPCWRRARRTRRPAAQCEHRGARLAGGPHIRRALRCHNRGRQPHRLRDRARDRDRPARSGLQGPDPATAGGWSSRAPGRMRRLWT